MGWSFRIAVSASVALHASVLVGTAGSWRTPRSEPPKAAETRANLTGDTIDVNEEGEEATTGDNATSPSTSTAEPTSASTAPPLPSPASVRPAAGSAHAKPRAGAIGAKTAGKGEGGEPGVFGAVGERGVVDLATAFTRQFPQAASADPAWTTVGFGNAGEADVTLVLDEAGKLVQTTVSSGAPPALKNGIARTVTLIRGRPFTAQGARTRLHVRATVSHDQVHDGLHGDVFAIGGSFSRTEGSAFFALAIGRRVDFRVTVR